jgi:hypothetical protein
MNVFEKNFHYLTVIMDPNICYNVLNSLCIKFDKKTPEQFPQTTTVTDLTSVTTDKCARFPWPNRCKGYVWFVVGFGIDGFPAKLIKYPNLYSISAANARLSQVVVEVSNHKDKGELPVLTRFTNLDNQTGILN